MKNKKPKCEITIPVALHTKLKTTAASKKITLSDYAVSLLEKALTKQTVEEKFLETYDFLNEENVQGIIDMTFEGNELREIVKSKFEVINQK